MKLAMYKGSGLALVLAALGSAVYGVISPGLAISLAAMICFVCGVSLFAAGEFLFQPGGAENNNQVPEKSVFARPASWVLAVLFTAFYVLIYFGDRIMIGGATLAARAAPVYAALDPLSRFMRGSAADQWFFYGTVYTLAVLSFGVRAAFKYRHIRYQVFRTVSVVFFQLAFAYIIPAVLPLFKMPEFYFSYFWPLKPDVLYPSRWLDASSPGLWFLVFAFAMTFVITPLLTYFFGKRWYCSWVCGCGGLAETMGDSFRQLSSKAPGVWKFERWIVHSILFLITIITALLWINSISGGTVLGRFSQQAAEWYGFYIGAIFSGVIGVGFYPLLGSRVWCRFGCPMAAYLGIIQRYFSRFRITTNAGQCISCGNCSTYCEMGIDVKWYAQRGQDIVRASCVGCGICSAVCPRGVLRLETGPVGTRVLQSRMAAASGDE